MMDFFNIFEYELASVQDQGNLPYLPLSYVKVTKVNINIADSLSFDDPENVSEFKNLHVDITKQKILFTKMLQQIVKSINDMMVNFVNVTLICEDTRFFTEIIPRQCERRELAVPYVFMNFLDIKEMIRNSYQCPYKKLDQIVEFIKICPLKEAENKSRTQLLQRVLRKLHNDKLLFSTSKRFTQSCRKLIKSTQKQQSLKSKYYKIIGLPFKSFPNEITNILAPEVPQDRKEICFIYEKQRFSGRAMIKIPEDYEPFFVSKNRMYIGQRYIELEASTEEQFQKAKIRHQNRSVERSPPRGNRDPRENQRGFFNIGIGSQRQRSRSPPERVRSRERHESFRNEGQVDHNRFQQDYRINSGESGIKVRGLPFAFSEWDVQNIFAQYNITPGSVKLGLKPGTSLKNGEAVILMRNYNDAQRSLGMNGFRVMGRYLQVMVIGKEDYLRYK